MCRALAEHFLQTQASLYEEPAKQLSVEAAESLRRYPWPGNVRELGNVIEHAHVLARGSLIELTDLPERLRTTATDGPVSTSELFLHDVERRTIAEALRRTRFNKSAASKLLGINVQKLARRIEKLGIPFPNA